MIFLLPVTMAECDVPIATSLTSEAPVGVEDIKVRKHASSTTQVQDPSAASSSRTSLLYLLTDDYLYYAKILMGSPRLTFSFSYDQPHFFSSVFLLVKTYFKI